LGKNVTIYLPDETAQKMEKLSEVNWSEICRKAINDYIETRTQTDLSSIITRLKNERKTDYTKGEILVYEEIAPKLSLKDLEYYATGVDTAAIMVESRDPLTSKAKITPDQANTIAITFMRNALRKFKRTLSVNIPDDFSDSYVEGATSAFKDIYQRVKSK
jgi:predicted transcriptional regulator